jgi:hypothetical protein
MAGEYSRTAPDMSPPAAAVSTPRQHCPVFRQTKTTVIRALRFCDLLWSILMPNSIVWKQLEFGRQSIEGGFGRTHQKSKPVADFNQEK